MLKHRYEGGCDELECPWCDEVILDGDRVRVMGDEVMHFECAVRMVLGGVNHQRGVCLCCHKGSEVPPDDPALSRREAARAALREWERLHGAAKSDKDVFRRARRQLVDRLEAG